jgi:hypothetical protein
MPNVARLRHGLAVALVSLALPAGAYAQGAGDDQYSDPFGADATPTATPAPATGAKATPAPSPAANTLPYTGVDAWPLALGGVLLLGAGVTLRARLRD